VGQIPNSLRSEAMLGVIGDSSAPPTRS